MMKMVRRSIGLNYSGKSSTFCTWAPQAKKVVFNSPEIRMELECRPHGFWESKSFFIDPGTPYSIEIDGKPLPDPASVSQPEGITGSSVAFDLSAYKWNDSEWKGISTEDLIIYELHTGAFTSEGTFAAIARHIVYFKELGITAIEIMPVAQFSGTRNWGYDGVFPFAVQNSYGGPLGLQQLVDLCHQNGIAVILDVVLNHIGPEGNILPEFGPFFTDKYKIPWGDAINYDDAWCDGVRRFFIENIQMWLRDFHIDGIRLDAIHAIRDFGPVNILQELHNQVEMLNTLSSSRHFLIGECDLNDVRYIAPAHTGGYALDAIWCDEFHHALHTLVTGESNGYYSDFGRIWHLVKSYNDAFVYDGIWSEHRKKVFGTRTGEISGDKFVVFSQNHDQVGNRIKGDRLSVNLSFEQLKLVAGAILFSPYIPLLFMGEEYAEENPFLFFTSHSGAELARLVREGRKKEFESFLYEGDFPDPQDGKTFEQSRLTGNRSSLQLKMFDYYKRLIELRKTIPLWKSMNRRNFKAESIEGRNVLQLTRWNGNQILLAILNFENTGEKVITCRPYIRWELIFNSGDIRWGGHGNIIDPEKTSITVPPHTIVILSSS